MVHYSANTPKFRQGDLSPPSLKMNFSHEIDPPPTPKFPPPPARPPHAPLRLGFVAWDNATPRLWGTRAFEWGDRLWPLAFSV